jgi:hypothetical protein
MLDYAAKKRLVEYHIAMRFSHLTTPEGYDLGFIPKGENPSSAMWGYDKHRKRHNLVINEALDEIIERPLPKSKRKKERFVDNFVRRVFDHEGAHSLFTKRHDQETLREKMREAKIPFHLWNLFEDARIEQCWRKTFRTHFNWLKFLFISNETPVPGEPPTHAIRLFQDCTRYENNPRAISAWERADKDPKMQYEGKGKARYGRRSLVKFYFRRVVKAPNTDSLIPIIQSWIKTFPETDSPRDYSGIGMDIGSASALMKDGKMPKGTKSADGGAHREIPETTASIATASGDPDAKPEKAVTREDTKTASIAYPVPKNRYFSRDSIREVDAHRADKLVGLFARFLEGGEGLVHSRNPTSKIDFRKYMRGAEDFYLRKGDDPAGVKRISFIFDASGSMSGVSDEGCYLAYVLNQLVAQRKVECQSMILTGGDFHREPMPFDPRILNHVATPGGVEGFVRTMRHNESELVNSKMTIFFTDGDITDEHINKEEWHRKGVYTVGLYVGDPEKSKSLHRWFDSVLVRNDIEAIADSLVQIIKRQ